MSFKSLTPLKILITRSALEPLELSDDLNRSDSGENPSELALVGSEAKDLGREFEALGCSVKICPVFYLSPGSLPLYPLSGSSPVRLAGEEDLIFVTRLSVDVFKKSGIALPKTSRCFSIGEGTANLFKSLFLNHNIYYPLSSLAQNSEGLLKLPEFDFMAGRKVFIFRGDSGRDFLADELRSRGAVVEIVNCYERQINPGFHRFWASEAENFPCDIVVLTSTESLRIFLETPRLISPHQKQEPWITVLPGRMQAMARDYGYQNLILLESASNASILRSIKAFFAAQ
jgi:uroporphyrinogen-III synthase